MNTRIQLFVAALAFAGVVSTPGSARAQGSSAGQTPPAGDAAAQAQTNSTTAANITTSAPATTPTAPASAKKVWTNEDMGAVHKNSTISTFSATNNKPGSAKPAANGKGGKDAKQYQNEIIRLQEKLPPLDEQITQLQAALNGDTVNSTRHVGGAKIDDWHDELVRAQKQREDIVAKISALQDEARRNGVPENQIPE
jgi:hypothetical protein